jgi:hypothetical protein
LEISFLLIASSLGFRSCGKGTNLEEKEREKEREEEEDERDQTKEKFMTEPVNGVVGVQIKSSIGGRRRRGSGRRRG